MYYIYIIHKAFNKNNNNWLFYIYIYIYSFGKIQNVGETKLFEEKKFSVSLETNFIFRFHIYFSASFASYFQYIYIYI